MEDETTILKTIDSLDFDYKLDNINGKCINCSSCYNYGHKLNNPFSFHLLCHRLVKNIEYIHSTIYLNGEQLKQKRCDDFIYWMVNNVNNVNVKTGQNEINSIIQELIKVWRDINVKLGSTGVKQSHLCDVSNLNSPLNFNDLNKKKMMSDYCQNFKTLFTKLTNRNKLNCNIYYNYFTKTKIAYNDVLEKCVKPNADISNCPYLCKNNDYNPERILTKLDCDKIPVDEKPPKLVPEEECNKEKDTLRFQLQQAFVAANNPAFNYSDPRIVFLILFTSWGIFLTFVLLYKLTPFSSWIRNKLLKKKIVRDNFDEAVDDESIYDYSGSVNTNMQNVGYNISYNSDWSPSR
ncbi:PIR Superfamily Protein [Plasmodium ovale curtisi]|uniref:PIR Superfamily Protein n=1 Tax=Plasmodium ovale curtisi TaxID=864141 RepID=A0A1A8XAM3_PLAOA|nr:PIR Superfamily Protein [Plasmodium ovale curtisi]SBT00868.1 PIR Superfamily Protein [Plasmodium ovale curtisi]